jgi:hypothetical protein
VRELKSRTIDGHTYEVQELPARLALRTLNRLSRHTLPALARAFGAAKSESLDDIDTGELGAALETLFEHLTDDELDGLTETLLKDVSLVDGKPLWAQMDVHFQGRMLALLKLLGFAIEVNFADFFGALRGLVGRKGDAKAA